MSDWLGEIKKRMKGPMISASMTNRVRYDMERLISEVERFQEKDGLRTREHNILVQENRNLTATIATLLEALKKYGVHGTECFRTHSHELTIEDLPSIRPVSHQKGLTFPAGEINCTCGLSEALATAQEK